jgi:malate/lactate dehydrogenase
VTDCPGDWWAAFDRLINAAQDAGDLVVLDGQEGAAAYAAANAAIVREAQQLCRAGERLRPVAVTVWDGAAKPADDATLAFQCLAAQAGFAALSVPTL